MNNNAKELIIAKGHDIGFSELKFARIEKWDDEFLRFEDWLGNNNHAEMQYLERHKDLRKDPRKILNSAKTIIVTATNYYTSGKHSGKQGFGKISRYCWGRDYHNVIKKMLKGLSKEIITLFPDTENRYFVDSGPVLEKQWAVRAGMGWQGKNGLIMHPKYGTWIFLGVILTNLEIEPDKPYIKDLCKDCTKCIDACPTKAIIKPKVIDANKCIAYHTIETKSQETIPEKIRENLNSWLFGCDICQEVCPWNKKATETYIKEFYPNNKPIEWGIDDIINMNEECFDQVFSRSPVKRLGFNGLRRNALALKNNRTE